MNIVRRQYPGPNVRMQFIVSQNIYILIPYYITIQETDKN